MATADWGARFAQYAERKQRDAVAAAISPFVTEADHRRPDLRAIGNTWSRANFDGDFYLSSPQPARPAASLVFVQSRDGNTGAANPSSLGGGEADKHLIYEGLSRAAADAVLAGAETIRGGNIVLSTWHPELVALRASLGLPRHPIQIVATLRGMPLETGLLFNVPDVPVVVMTVPAVVAAMRDALAERPWVTPLPMRAPADVRAAFQDLRRLGITTISCIGGRMLARQLLDAALIEDLYLTTAAKDGGEPGTPLYPGPLDGNLVIRKRGTGADQGVVFEHLTLERRLP